ncbi:Ribosomal protein L12 family protein [Raphanus sativus]|nr:Ribosomal protein L12 family protein [Raphanus sativus]
MRNLRVISSHLSRGLRSIQSNPIQSRRGYSSQSENVSKIVTELSNLTLLETMDLTELLRKKLGVTDMPVMAAMMPGWFESASKIKVIKEVRAVTDLGLKEAKDLVEKAPTLLKKGVSKEEAEKIIEKLKAVGAKVDMECYYKWSKEQMKLMLSSPSSVYYECNVSWSVYHQPFTLDNTF